jgi:hypothetical protein
MPMMAAGAMSPGAGARKALLVRSWCVWIEPFSITRTSPEGWRGCGRWLEGGESHTKEVDIGVYMGRWGVYSTWGSRGMGPIRAQQRSEKEGEQREPPLFLPLSPETLAPVTPFASSRHLM